MHQRSKVATAAVLALLGLLWVGCARERKQLASEDGGAPPYRTAWLGSSEGWGLLGLSEKGGVLAYRSATNLEAPTWAPPELDPIAEARPTYGAIWVRFKDGQLGLFDYSTGRLRTFGKLADHARVAQVIPESTAVLESADSTSLSLVGEGAPWRYRLPGRLVRLTAIDDGRVLAAVREDTATELLLLRPPEKEPLGRVTLPVVRDLVVTAWGRRLYYLPAESEAALMGLSLPELRPVGRIDLPRPGTAVSATPSGHRLYVAGADSLYVFDRLAGRRIRTVVLPDRVSQLRFGQTGSTLLGRVEGRDRAVILQVGIDSVLGVIETRWTEDLPVALPGGRLIAHPGNELVLYTLPDLNQIARVQDAGDRRWVPVEWHPPQPRPELVRRAPNSTSASQPPAVKSDSAGSEGAALEDGEPRPGYYAVVLAARAQPGVDRLVSWLRGVGFKATRERHRDAMGVTWYRAMVGPFANRPQAESAARDLGARYGYKPWILSVTESQTDVDTPPDTSGVPADTMQVDGDGRRRKASGPLNDAPLVRGRNDSGRRR